MNHNDHRLIDSNNVKHYITGQKSPLEADFLLLSKEAQAEILENFNVSGIKELLDKDPNNTTLYDWAKVYNDDVTKVLTLLNPINDYLQNFQ